MPGQRTRDALLEHGALLLARHGVARLTARQLHEAVGARNESALHYHFGSIDGLVTAIIRQHVAEVETRRVPVVDAIRGQGQTGDLRALVRALAVPMSEDLATPVGRAHLRVIAQLSHPALAYEMPFQAGDAPAGTAVVKWLWRALHGLPEAIRVERMALLRAQLISGFGLRSQLIDDDPDVHGGPEATELFVENLVDVIVAGLRAEPSPEALEAAVTRPRTRTARR